MQVNWISGNKSREAVATFIFIMPVKPKKELYIAKSMQDLNLKTNVDTDKNTKIKM